MVLSPSCASGQVAPVPVPEIGGDAAEVSGFLVGGSGSVVGANGEAFEFTGTGFGGQLFLGAAFDRGGTFGQEVRGGVTLSSLPDHVFDGRAKLFSVFVEGYLTRRVSPVTLRLGPRVVWLWESRPFFLNTVSGFGFGGVANAQFPLSSRTSIETAVVFNSYTLNSAEIEGSPPDLDRFSPGTMWECRVGIVYRLSPASQSDSRDAERSHDRGTDDGG